MKGLLSIGLLTALLLPAAAFARDADGVRIVNCPRGVLHAGDVVELTWSAPPRDVEELEILLSVDGGRHFALRVSPELDARDGHWYWRVPDVSAENASLRVRIGDARGESLGEPTPAFRIMGSAAVGSIRASRAATPEVRCDAMRETNATWPAPVIATAAENASVHEAAWWSASENTAAGGGAADLSPGQASFHRAADGVSFAPPRRESGDRPARQALPWTLARPVISIVSPLHVATGISRNLPLRE
jgi:hypothetical protein